MFDQLAWRSDNFYLNYGVMALSATLCIFVFGVTEFFNEKPKRQKFMSLFVNVLAYAPMVAFCIIVIVEWHHWKSFGIEGLPAAFLVTTIIIAPQLIFVLIAMLWIRPKRTSVHFLKAALILGLHVFGIWWANQVEI